MPTEHFWLMLAQLSTTIFAVAATGIGIMSWLANHRRNVGWKLSIVETHSQQIESQVVS